ncbi:MAG: hypothetical protein IKK54_04185 [Anaerotignum sp.]|nr:hypothetical protein [Anaerotignum sp.]
MKKTNLALEVRFFIKRVFRGIHIEELNYEEYFENTIFESDCGSSSEIQQRGGMDTSVDACSISLFQDQT